MNLVDFKLEYGHTIMTILLPFQWVALFSVAMSLPQKVCYPYILQSLPEIL